MSITKPPPSTLRLRVDTDALASNWRALDRLSGSAATGAAIKANCYGLGIDACLPTLRDAGAQQFFVAHWSEVESAARHVSPSQVSVLHGPLTQSDAEYARVSGAVPVINSIEQARLWTEAGGGPCDLMVDTGINRLGVSVDQLSEPAIADLDVRILMSHLSSADEESELNAKQLERFHAATQAVDHRLTSLANSAGIALGRNYHFDLTRPGLSLYGGVPRSELDDEIRQVAYPEGAVIQVRRLSAGDAVGYNATFVAEKAMKVATVSLGYADGILHAWNGKAELSHGDANLPLLGKVSMDMIVVDCSNTPDLRAGDWVGMKYSLPDAAQQTLLSQYELLTVLGQRLTR